MFSFICPNSLLIFCYLFSISLIYCPWQSLTTIPLSLTICCFLSLSVIVLVYLQFQKIVFHNTLIRNRKHLLCLCVLVFILLPFFPLNTPITSIRQKWYTRKDNVKYLILHCTTLCTTLCIIHFNPAWFEIFLNSSRPLDCGVACMSLLFAVRGVLQSFEICNDFSSLDTQIRGWRNLWGIQCCLFLVGF